MDFKKYIYFLLLSPYQPVPNVFLKFSYNPMLKFNIICPKFSCNPTLNLNVIRPKFSSSLTINLISFAPSFHIVPHLI